MNKKERESHVKKTEKKELKCPLNSNLKCENCKLYVFFSKSIGRECALIFTALRSV